MDMIKHTVTIHALHQKMSTLSALLPSIGPSQFLDVIITVAPEQSLDVIDDLLEQGITRCKIQFIIQKDARLQYVMKTVDPSINPLARHSEALRTAAHMDEISVHDKGEIIERDIILTLAGDNAQADVKCLCLGRGSRVYKFNTLQDHQAENGTSNLVIKSVLDDDAKLFCKSLIHIQKTAQRTSADLLNKNILLSRKARATSIPMLEVLADDVRCSHGAAISKLDDEHFFYLQSRGLAQGDSRQLLIDAFLT